MEGIATGTVRSRRMVEKKETKAIVELVYWMIRQIAQWCPKRFLEEVSGATPHTARGPHA